MKTTDFLVVGGGVVGLSLAVELGRQKLGRVTLVEKELDVGMHASGRNSGVIHAGIYYPAQSQKAKFCIEGHRLLTEFADEHRLPILKCGKVIVANRPENVATLSTLWERATANGVTVERIDLQQLRELEPEAQSHEWAIWSPRTSVIDSKAVLQKLKSLAVDYGVELLTHHEVTDVNPETRVAQIGNHDKIQYGFLYNCAGLHADRVAHRFGVGRRYRILPFKGMYWKANPGFASRVQRLIYPSPDVRMPFLGVHITRTVDGQVLFGPTAVPAFGRENYSWLKALEWTDTPGILAHLARMWFKNPGNFRDYVHDEVMRYLPSRFLAEAQALAPQVQRSDIGAFYKVGLRAQLMDLEKGQLEMDFVIEKGPHSLHVLNAVSPAFTCALAFAPYLGSRFFFNGT